MSYAFDHGREYQLLPGLTEHARADLGPVRTPLQRAVRLGNELGIELYFKRDDAQPLGMGGNKVRQLEFYLGPALSQQADTILITGAIQSNFARLCAAACRRLGLHPVIQLEDRVPTNDPLYKSSGNVLLNQLYDAEIHYLPEGENEALADARLDELAMDLQQKGHKPFVIHLGVDHPPFGALGYSLAAAELRIQLQEQSINATHLITPSGSGITHSGVLAGVDALDWDIAVEGICVRRDKSLQKQRIEKRATEAATLLGNTEIPSHKVRTHDDVLAPGYGQLNPQVAEAIQKAAKLEGILVDPVYSGRTLAGLITLVEQGYIAKGSCVVFIHTGGTPALFAYQNKLDFE